MHCYMCRVIVGCKPSRAVAALTCSPSGNVVGLCRKHLDDWFDIADEDDSDNEPTALRWLPQVTGTLAELGDR